MFNQNFNSNPENHIHQEDDELDEPNEEQEDALHRTLDCEVRKIKRAAFESCISDIEVEDDTLFKCIWGQAQGIVREQWFREVAIISAILIFKTGLFWACREALRDNLEIGSL